MSAHDHSHPHGHSDDHSHGNGHSHDHGPEGHDHGHDHSQPRELTPVTAEALDLDIPDRELSPAGLGRRSFLQRAGLIGAAAAGASVLVQAEAAAADPAAAAARDAASVAGSYQWLAGDHHIHTQYSSDAQYRVADQVQHAGAYGLDWMVITDHGSVTHAKLGVDQVNPQIVAARKEYGDMLVFQGVEWNIPSAEHGTVFVHPGANEVAVLKGFENSYDGVVNGWTASSDANEVHALEGLDFLAAAVKSGQVADAAFFANHPARKGLDSPHEIRNWRDRQPTIALGMEGAPGHQAAGIKSPLGAGAGRGFYDNSPTADSFAPYPMESYITWGGFDWMTSTVGGLWDSLLAEGKPWWITSNSDSHTIYLDDSVRGGAGSSDEFNSLGHYLDPVHGTAGPKTTNGDFWPGYYSKTHVGSLRPTYAGVLNGLRSGRIYVDHGGLVGGLQVGLRAKGAKTPGATFGSMLTPKKGTRMELVITVDPATHPNWAQFVPHLARVDVIRGAVTGVSADRDTFSAPTAKVIVQKDVSAATSRITFVTDLGVAEEPFYVRVRGTDGNRGQVGINGAAVDPAGPAADVQGDADPWADLWFYTNPIWVIPA